MSKADTPADVPGARPASLDRLEVLIGEWETMATFDAGFFGPDSPEVTVPGRTTVQWLEGGFFLNQRFSNDHPDMPNGITVIGVGDEPDTFVQHYYDSRGVARDYRMTLDGREWTLHRESPGFSQRYVGTISADGTTITGAWQASADGSQWRHDFKLTHTKTG